MHFIVGVFFMGTVGIVNFFVLPGFLNSKYKHFQMKYAAQINSNIVVLNKENLRYYFFNSIHTDIALLSTKEYNSYGNTLIN